MFPGQIQLTIFVQRAELRFWIIDIHRNSRDKNLDCDKLMADDVKK